MVKAAGRAFTEPSPGTPQAFTVPKDANTESASSEEWINGTISSRRERTLTLTPAVVRWGPFLPSLHYTRLSFHGLVVPHPMSAFFSVHAFCLRVPREQATRGHTVTAH